jgi:hypothetical protein
MPAYARFRQPVSVTLRVSATGGSPLWSDVETLARSGTSALRALERVASYRTRAEGKNLTLT